MTARRAFVEHLRANTQNESMSAATASERSFSLYEIQVAGAGP